MLFEACSAFTHITACMYGLHARRVAIATLYTEGSNDFVASAVASIATGWERTSSRAGLSPAVDQCLSRRTITLHWMAELIAFSICLFSILFRDLPALSLN